MFVVPPPEAEVAPAMQPTARQQLSAIGYALPERIEPGFLLLAADASCERQVPFYWLGTAGCAPSSSFPHSPTRRHIRRLRRLRRISSTGAIMYDFRRLEA